MFWTVPDRLEDGMTQPLQAWPGGPPPGAIAAMQLVEQQRAEEDLMALFLLLLAGGSGMASPTRSEGVVTSCERADLTT